MKASIRMKSLLTALAIFGFASAVPETASAQPGNWQPAGPGPGPVQMVQAQHKRSGLLLGFSAGSALGDEAQGQTGAMASAYIGWFLNPNLALMFTTTAFETDSYYYDDCSIDYCPGPDMIARDLQVTGFAAQKWLSDRFWLRGTVGAATADVSGVGQQDGLGWGAAAGVDIISGNTFALDLRLHAIGGVFDLGKSARSGIGLGFSWR